MNITPHIPKGQRYTIGVRIENKLLDLLELSYVTYFTEKEKKLQKINDCVLMLDTLKFLTQIAWQSKLVANNCYADISAKFDEIGKMFGGWRKNLENNDKKNRAI